MTADILDGRQLADQRLSYIRAEVERRAAAGLRAPRLTAILPSRNPGSLAYAERQKVFAERAGVDMVVEALAENADMAAALELIATLNRDPLVDGVLPLFPFASGIEPSAIAAAIDPDKDVDGLHPLNAGLLASGLDGFTPCTALGALALADTVVETFKGRTVTVVGSSIRVGRPLALLLLRREATVTVAQAATVDLKAACRDAEVVFVAVGRPGLITADHLRTGAIVIDIGVNRSEGPNGERIIVGDVDLASAREKAAVITAAPDGVGPVTTSFLMENTLKAAQRNRPV